MDSQASRFKEAIIEVLLKRIIPLEKQLEAQTEIIDQLTQSLEALSKMLLISEQQSSKPLQPAVRRDSLPTQPVVRRDSLPTQSVPRRDSLVKFEDQKLKEQNQKERDLQALKQALVLGLGKIKMQELTEEQQESLDANEPKSETEDILEREEELQIIDIELSQLGEFKDGTTPEFFYSELTIGAIASLAALNESELYLETKPPPKVRWILQLFWQIQGKSFSQTEAWEQWKNFIKSNTGKLDEAFYQMRSLLDYSMNNLNLLEKLLLSRKNLLNPSLFAYSPPASHLMAIISNVIEFSGVISAASTMRYNRLLYKKEQDS